MNANHIINMIVKMVIGKLVHTGMNAGFDAMSKMGSRKGKPQSGAADEQFAEDSNGPWTRENSAKIKQATRLPRS
ncbi:hypothetical protein ACFORG_14775 [Lutimaribacter marinistellae]|uniref:Uncharacterized protein n=1 Tax=Lutimaribacter marinistellae TaxID=1820329 RepID=A0ABV7TI92_9RHOB